MALHTLLQACSYEKGNEEEKQWGDLCSLPAGDAAAAVRRVKTLLRAPAGREQRFQRSQRPCLCGPVFVVAPAAGDYGCVVLPLAKPLIHRAACVLHSVVRYSSRSRIKSQTVR
jgi:hypothetical protein